MPQGSVAYAVARVHIRMREALDGSHLDRLLSATSYDDALRTLAEIGWAEASDSMNAEGIIAAHVRDACALIKTITPCPDATDSFLLRYDGLNLKMLLKARCLSKQATHLSECGVYPIDRLRHAVAEHSYTVLPQTLETALSGLEKTLAVREDALAIDTVVDQALFTLIHQKLHRVKSPAIRRYFAGRVDMLSAIMLLRVKHLGRNASFMREMLLPGGTVTPEAWIAAFEKPELITGYIAKYGDRVRTAASLSVTDAKSLPLLEKAMDDTLLKPFSSMRYDPLRIEPLIGYLLGVEREAAAVRLILAGIKNGFSKEAIRERLRELYGN